MFPIGDSQARRTLPVVTLLLIGINCYVFWRQVIAPPPVLEAIIQQFSLIPRVLWKSGLQPLVSGRYGELTLAACVPLVSSQFLHGSVMHLVSNMISLWIFGDNVEERLGSFRYLLFYLVAGVCAGLVHTMADVSSEIFTVGASGAIAGVMGAYFVCYPFARVRVVIPLFFWFHIVEIPSLLFMGLWLYLQVQGGLALIHEVAQGDGGIAWWAHIGGFVAGILLYFLLAPARKRNNYEMAAGYIRRG